MIAIQASEILQAEAGAGLVNLSHQILYIVMSVGCAVFLIIGVVTAIRSHTKRGVAAALGALVGAIGLAVTVTHMPGLFQRFNQEFEQLPGGVGSSSVDRGW